MWQMQSSQVLQVRKVVVRTADTNVLVLAVALLDKLQMLTEGRVHL